MYCMTRLNLKTAYIMEKSVTTAAQNTGLQVVRNASKASEAVYTRLE